MRKKANTHYENMSPMIFLLSSAIIFIMQVFHVMALHQEGFLSPATSVIFVNDDSRGFLRFAFSHIEEKMADTG